jgi:tetratricopeptide (TPR) repeat protein
MSIQESITKRVHNGLVHALGTMHGETLKVLESVEPGEGLVQYAFDDVVYHCEAAVYPLNERAATFRVSARLGRLYVGYRKALRWLACNRAGNSVGISVEESALYRRELWVCTNRVTLPDDADGIRETLLDVRGELERLRIGLGSWFPQMLDGSDLSRLEEHARKEANNGLGAILNSPKGYGQWLMDNPDSAQESDPGLVVEVMGWLERWEEQLVWLDRSWESCPGAERTDRKKAIVLFRKAKALLRLERAQEALALADEIRKLVDEEEWTQLGILTASTLYQLGRHEDVLETLQSARFDTNPRAWFWRSVAHTRLGQEHEMGAAYMRYEEGIGVDIHARRMLSKFLREEGETLGA